MAPRQRERTHVDGLGAYPYLGVKVATDEQYDGETPSKLDHLAIRPMNELIDLGLNTAHMNQRPSSPFGVGDRVVKKADDDATPGVVIDMLPPEKEASITGQTMDGGAIQVTFPSILDEGPGDWRDIHPAKLASYCVDQDIKCLVAGDDNTVPTRRDGCSS